MNGIVLVARRGDLEGADKLRNKNERMSLKRIQEKNKNATMT